MKELLEQLKHDPELTTAQKIAILVDNIAKYENRMEGRIFSKAEAGDMQTHMEQIAAMRTLKTELQGKGAPA